MQLSIPKLMPLRSLLVLLLALAFAACDASDATGPDDGHNDPPSSDGGGGWGGGGSGGSDDPPPDEPQYTRAYISTVEVLQIPMSAPDGSGWDLASGPDLIFDIVDTQGNVLASSSQIRSDLGPGDFPVGWSGNIQVSDWNRSYTLRLWDHDSGTAHDFIGAAGTSAIEDHSGNYPSSFALNSGEIRTRIYLRWE